MLFWLCLILLVVLIALAFSLVISKISLDVQ
jgi:hypothetical protein